MGLASPKIHDPPRPDYSSRNYEKQRQMAAASPAWKCWKAATAPAAACSTRRSAAVPVSVSLSLFQDPLLPVVLGQRRIKLLRLLLEQESPDDVELAVIDVCT